MMMQRFEIPMRALIRKHVLKKADAMRSEGWRIMFSVPLADCFCSKLRHSSNGGMFVIVGRYREQACYYYHNGKLVKHEPL